MGEKRSHKITANRIAEKFKTEYNPQKGPDIKTNDITVEVETSETVSEALKQLRGYKGPAYIAGVNRETVEKALEITEGTTVGVMDNQGKILRKSTRK